jgi:CheY-like chemotaxis protein
MSQCATVLVVDDDVETVETMREILASEGHVVLSAANGREALLVARDTYPDLVLLDLNMPDMDGRAFLAAARDEPGLADLNVVIVSGANDTMGLECDVVAKPLRLDTLLGLIDRVARSAH